MSTAASSDRQDTIDKSGGGDNSMHTGLQLYIIQLSILNASCFGSNLETDIRSEGNAPGVKDIKNVHKCCGKAPEKSFNVQKLESRQATFANLHRTYVNFSTNARLNSTLTSCFTIS